MVLLRSATSVGQLTPDNSRYLHSHSRHLIEFVPLHSEKNLWNVYTKYGASTRNLFVYADEPSEYEDRILTVIRRLSSEGLTTLLQDADAGSENSHLVISTGPLPGNRSKAERKFASTYVLEECCKRILGNEVLEMRSHYNLLRGNPISATAAGMVFEHRAHPFLRQQTTIDIFPILGRVTTKHGKNAYYDDYTATNNDTDKTRVDLPPLEEHHFIDKIPTHLKYNTYYRPKRTNFPSVDSWILIQPDPKEPPIFIMFQITINASSHGVNVKGLELIDTLPTPVGTRRCLVVLTPSDVTPEIGPVPVDYLRRKFPQLDLDRDFPVFHYPVDSDAVFSNTV